MTNAIIVIILLLIVVSASFYIYKAKKNGATCVGCPYSKQCGSKSCCCSDADSSKTE